MKNLKLCQYCRKYTSTFDERCYNCGQLFNETEHPLISSIRLKMKLWMEIKGIVLHEE